MEIKCLDNGYVRLLRTDGCDLDVENAARASFVRNVQEVTKGFIERLANEGHMSPFRHVGLWLEFKFPGDVRGQFLKHIVGNCVVEEGTAWNEQSNRGKRTQLDYHYPAPHSPAGRWGQGEELDLPEFKADLERFYQEAERLYNSWLEKGVCAENCRKFIPFYGTYTTVRAKMSLEAAHHFWKLRQTDHAQKEIKEYASAISQIAGKTFPVSWSALTNKQ